MTTVLDALANRLATAAAHDHVTERPPVIVLWTDGEGKWQPALPTLRERLPNLWTWGEFDPKLNRGPAAWVKWRLGKVASGDPVPVLYLPGVQRAQFRSLEDFPEPLKPIAELQFRGRWWTQESHKDWTPLAFLSAKEGGLGLSVAKDADTISTLERLIALVLRCPLSELKKDRLDAETFVDLLTDDLEGDILDWLENPAAMRAGCPDPEWSVFIDAVRRRLGVDLDRDGAVVVADRLVQRNGGWAKVWNRYVIGVPGSYSHVHLVLEKAQPAGLMFDKSSLLPHNDEQELALRGALMEVGGLPEAKARQRIRELEAEHGSRRGWVWAKLGRARMATVLQHLAALDAATESPVGGNDMSGIASWYGTTGWKADAAALGALALAEHADRAAIHAAVRVLYLPWLQRVAERLRESVKAKGYPKPQGVPTEDGTCLLFADGLRWDVGAVLRDRLATAGKKVEMDGRWVAFPPVTGTSKFDISPIREQLIGGAGAADFTPSVKGTNKVLDSATFRKLMAAAGVQILEGNQTGDATGRAWSEFGDIDKYGHKHGCKTARHVDGQLRELEQRVSELLAAGWKCVRIATDHGWLLVPGGMPSAKVSADLTESRWGRCAVLKTTTQVDLPSLPWAWDPGVAVTYAPGVCAFRANTEYAHGGLTVQECYTPILSVSADLPEATGAIGEVKWLGLRCKVRVTTASAGLRLDLRGKVSDTSSSFLQPEDRHDADGGAPRGPRPVGGDGLASILVSDKNGDRAGSAAFVVLLAQDGKVLDKRRTTIGGDE